MPDLASDTRRVIELNKGKVLNKNIQ
jgi:hypothetical protein